MLSRLPPKFVVASALFLASGLIVAGLGYPRYLKWKQDDETSSAIITPLSAPSPAPLNPATVQPISVGKEDSRKSDDGEGDKEEIEDEDHEDDDDDHRQIVSPTQNIVSPPPPPAVTPTPSGALGAAIVLTQAEVAKHNTAANCWFIISGKVYDVTGYQTKHPGGSGEILSNCGKDATVAFSTQGGKGSHTQMAADMLSQYFIGNLGGTKIR